MNTYKIPMNWKQPESSGERLCFEHGAVSTISGFWVKRPYFTVYHNGHIGMTFKVEVQETKYPIIVYDYSMMHHIFRNYEEIREIQVIGEFSPRIIDNRYTNKREPYLRVTAESMTYITSRAKRVDVLPEDSSKKDAYRYLVMQLVSDNWEVPGVVYSNQIEYDQFFPHLSKRHRELYPQKTVLTKRTIQDPVDAAIERKRRFRDINL